MAGPTMQRVSTLVSKDIGNYLTNQQTWGGVIYNVKSYGAKGDGTTDDASSFQSAFSISGKKVIVIPPGSYYLGDTITVNSDTTVWCFGTMLEKVNGESLFYADEQENITFINTQIVGDGSGTTYVADQETLHFNDCDNIRIEGGFINDIKGRSAILMYGCRDIWVEDLIIEDYSYGGILLLFGCNRAKILHNKVINCTNTTDDNIYPIMLSGYDGAIYPVAEDIVCDGNYVDNTSPWWEGIDFHGGKNIKIINNTVKGSYIGIAGVSSADYYISDILIENNTCYGETTGTSRNIANDGIVCDGLYGSSKSVVIRGNLLYNFGYLTSASNDRGGIKAQDIQDFIIENNYIYQCQKYGIVSFGGLTDGYIRNNKIIDVFHNGDNLSFGVNMRNGTVYKNVFIENNDILWSGDASHETITGIAGPSTTTDAANAYITAKDNRISVKTTTYSGLLYMLPLNYTASPQATGIRIGHVGDICSRTDLSAGANLAWVCTVAGDGTTPGTWVKSGSVNLEGSITWDPGSLNDGAGETSSAITATGAALGDFVLVSAPYDLQGITCNGYVSAANAVKIRIQNETTGTIDLASGTWRVRVIKQ